MSSHWDSVAKEQYNTWKHHPVTVAMLQYYKDYASVLQRELLQRWKEGGLISQDEQEMRGRVNTLEEIAEQPYEVITTFYHTPSVTDEAYDAA